MIQTSPSPAPSPGPVPPAAAPVPWPSVGLFLIALLAVIVLARDFLMPVVLAWLLALTFSPVRRWLNRRGVPSPVVAAVVVFGLMAGVTVAVLALSGPVRGYVEDAPQIIRQMEWKLRGVSSAIETVAEASDRVESLTKGGDEAQPKVSVEQPGVLTRLALGMPYLLAQIVLTLALLFFLIAAGDLFLRRAIQAAPRVRDKRRTLEVAIDIERKISRYFFTITLINAGLGIAIGIALWALGMPNPLMFGAAAFILNYVPYLGAVFGAAVTFAIGLMHYPAAGGAALAAGVYLLLTAIEGQFVTPYAVGRTLRLNPVLVFMAVAFWGWAWSVLGMIIAVPVLIALRAFAESVPALKGVGLFLTDEDEEAAELPLPDLPPG